MASFWTALQLNKPVSEKSTSCFAYSLQYPLHRVVKISEYLKFKLNSFRNVPCRTSIYCPFWKYYKLYCPFQNSTVLWTYFWINLVATSTRNDISHTLLHSHNSKKYVWSSSSETKTTTHIILMSSFLYHWGTASMKCDR